MNSPKPRLLRLLSLVVLACVPACTALDNVVDRAQQGSDIYVRGKRLAEDTDHLVSGERRSDDASPADGESDGQ
ncbi:MAG: hypothetical protein IT457_13005 [Planctomycetes bacterium]|nr:hypothetical protein [Planctomycetota bacterium]